MNDPISRSDVIDRLTKARWISSSWIKDVAPGQVEAMIEYTDVGKAQMRKLHSLLDELEFTHGYRGGELEVLCQLARTFAKMFPENPPLGGNDSTPRR